MTGIIGIHNEEINWEDDLFLPCWIAGKTKPIRLYVGKPIECSDEAACGLYVDDSEYTLIDHALPYIFINYPAIEFGEGGYDYFLKQAREIECENDHIHIVPNNIKDLEMELFNKDYKIN